MMKIFNGFFLVVSIMVSGLVAADAPDGDHTYYEDLAGENILSVSEQGMDGTFTVDFNSNVEGFSCKSVNGGTGLITFNNESLRSADMVYAFLVNALMNDKLSVISVKVRVDEQWDSGALETVSCEVEGLSFTSGA
ncbi:hypothetical protein [Alloalcanivorax profundimaris]|uniref:hypothetical protein n=1 Tax=Alloalcanivorax profundimaris TaxID=2735259 RepID=UPI0018898F9D|nr:hypothetical protein [Alloalcanivorax profundimaris]MBF1802398.1 hypothetical protein [Alloalcanivorax profundimaris]